MEPYSHEFSLTPLSDASRRFRAPESHAVRDDDNIHMIPAMAPTRPTARYWDGQVNYLTRSVNSLSTTSSPSPPTEDEQTSPPAEQKQQQQSSSPTASDPEQTASPKQRPEQGKKEPCNVCFTVTERHNYYGGLVCSSCRAFFRRAVPKKKYAGFQCRQNGTCSVDSKSRKSCASCRFQRCLAAGMNPMWIMTDAEKEARRKRNANNCTTVAQPQSKIHLEQLTVEELLKLKLLFEQTKERVLFCGFAYCVRNFASTDKLTQVIYLRRKVGPEFINSISQCSRILFHKLCAEFDDMQQISLVDRQALLKHNSPNLFIMLLSFYLHPTDFEEHALNLQQMFRSRWFEMPEVRPVLQMFEQRSATGQRANFDYDCVYPSPWAPSWETERKHHALLMRVQRWLRLTPDGYTDPILNSFAMLLILLSPDGVPLQQPKYVEQLHAKYAMLLHRHLKSLSLQSYNAKFVEGLMLKSITSEAFDIHSQMLPV